MQNPIKYPRTPHLPWSPGFTDDDVFNKSLSHFENLEVVVTEKMDGENTTLYCDGLHARSIDGRSHPSRDWLKAWHAQISTQLPLGWRFCGENMFAEHSIRYDSLNHYFYLFSVWNEENTCLSWDETQEWVERLGCSVPSVLYMGEWNEKEIKQITINEEIEEGYVVRTSDGFPYENFTQHIAKWVRPNHVQTDQHWMHQEITPNGLKK